MASKMAAKIDKIQEIGIYKISKLVQIGKIIIGVCFPFRELLTSINYVVLPIIEIQDGVQNGHQN